MRLPRTLLATAATARPRPLGGLAATTGTARRGPVVGSGRHGRRSTPAR